MAYISVTDYHTVNHKSPDICFDCCGVAYCKHALCEHMPPEEHSRCAFYYKGSCRSVDAQIQALEKVKRAVSKAIKELKGEKDYE